MWRGLQDLLQSQEMMWIEHEGMMGTGEQQKVDVKNLGGHQKDGRDETEDEGKAVRREGGAVVILLMPSHAGFDAVVACARSWLSVVLW